MNINQIKIRNLNRRLIAGVLTFTIAGTVIKGFDTAKYISNFGITRNMEVIASFDKLKECYFVEIYNLDDNSTQFYIAEKIEILDEKNENVGSLYLNLLDGRNIFVQNIPFNMLNTFSIDYGKSIVNEISVEEYLNNSELVKSMYTKGDIKFLVEYIKKTNYKENKKTK